MSYGDTKKRKAFFRGCSPSPSKAFEAEALWCLREVGTTEVVL
jgi:hypothetical protein